MPSVLFDLCATTIEDFSLFLIKEIISSALSSPSESITITPSTLYFKKASHNPTDIALWCPILKFNLKILILIFLPKFIPKGYSLSVEQSSTAITFKFKSYVDEIS